jgi:hypothetical protein
LARLGDAEAVTVTVAVTVCGTIAVHWLYMLVMVTVVGAQSDAWAPAWPLFTTAAATWLVAAAAVVVAGVVTAAAETAPTEDIAWATVAVAFSVAGVLAVEVWVVATPRHVFSWFWQSDTAKVASGKVAELEQRLN